MHALINHRNRGLVAVRANSPEAIRLLNEMNAAFSAFKSKNDDRIEAIQRGLDELGARQASMLVGGDAGNIGNSAGRRQSINNLGTFARSGRVEDLVNGLQVNNSMSSSSGPDGGYTVPRELSDTLMTLQRNDSVMRRLARVVTSNSAVFEQPIATTGIASGWVGEKESRPETTGNTFSVLEYPSMEVYANPAVTQRLLDDSAYDLGTFISAEISTAFNEKEGDAFIVGDGIAKPRGFLSYDVTSTADATRPFGTLQYKATGVAAALSDGSNNGMDALIGMVYALKAKYRQNATWLMNSTTAAQVRKFKDSMGRYLWVDSLVQGQPSTLLGYPVEIDESMSDVGANAFPIAFGDFNRGYLIVDRTGVRLLRDALTNKPYVHFYTTKRVGGGLLDSNAIKLLKCATS